MKPATLRALNRLTGRTEALQNRISAEFRAAGTEYYPTDARLIREAMAEAKNALLRALRAAERGLA
jgi:hypothetical protein